MKKLLMLVPAAIICCSFSACSEKDINDAAKAASKAADILQDTDEDKTVLSVKNAENSSYPGITYGEAFDNFFIYPEWKHFTGSSESSDEECEVVEFTGNCTYQDVEVEALIQFTLYDDGTFEATYLSFNDVPQNMQMLSGLLKTAFENAKNDLTSYEGTQYKGNGYTITLSDDWVKQSSSEADNLDLSFKNSENSGNITVYITETGDNPMMSAYLNHMGDSGRETFLNKQMYEEADGRYYSEYIWPEENGNEDTYYLVCAAETNGLFYSFSFNTSDKDTYYKLRSSAKKSFSSVSFC